MATTGFGGMGGVRIFSEPFSLVLLGVGILPLPENSGDVLSFGRVSSASFLNLLGSHLACSLGQFRRPTFQDAN